MIALALVVAWTALTVQPAFALLQDARVWHDDGQAPSLNRDVPGELTIHQPGNRLGIYWESFSIGAGETVTFIQPGERTTVLDSRGLVFLIRQ